MGLTGEEPVDLPLVGVLGCEGCSSYLARLRGDRHYLLLVCHCVDVKEIKKKL